jgi:hypothetical protein
VVLPEPPFCDANTRTSRSCLTLPFGNPATRLAQTLKAARGKGRRLCVPPLPTVCRCRGRLAEEVPTPSHTCLRTILDSGS